MDTRIVVGLILLFVVAFFGYQWWRHVSKKPAPSLLSQVASGSGSAAVASSDPPAVAAPAPQAKMPNVAGQTEKEMLAKEPLQDRKLASQQEPVTYEGHAPAEFESNIRHPEQSFHQPAPPTMTHHDVDSGRAIASPSTPSLGEQGFTPEMAQNDGPLVGNVYAFDGMEQTGFATF